MGFVMPDEFYFPSKESHEVAYQIGVLCIVWGGVDHLINAMLAHHLGLDELTKTEIMMGNLDLKRKLAILKPLAFVRETPERFRNLEAALDFIDNIMRPERNRYVHDIYRFTPEESVLTSYRTQISKPKPSERILRSSIVRNVKPSDIEELIADLEICTQFLAGHFIATITDSRAINDAAAEAVKTVYAGYCDALSALIAKYKERHKSNGSLSPKSPGGSTSQSTA